MKKEITILFFAACFSARAEFGVSGGAAFNYKSDFRTTAESQGRSTSPDNIGNRTYDDGYVTTETPPIIPGKTRYYGYDQTKGAQVVNNPGGGGTLKLNSAQNIIDAQAVSGQQNEAQPAIEIYWQNNLTENKKLNFGLRAALRWQRIELDNKTLGSTTVETISDTYSYTAGALLTSTYSGYPTPTPGYPVINDTPTTRSTTYAAGTDITCTRNLDADLFGFDLGPTLSLNLTEKMRAVLSAGGTVAWMRSDFSYSDGALASGRDTKEEFLVGAYASADLQYQIGEHWGVFTGAAYTKLQDFNQQVDGRSASLQFGDSYTLRTGLFFQ